MNTAIALTTSNVEPVEYTEEESLNLMVWLPQVKRRLMILE
jgi:hypothetical protein